MRSNAQRLARVPRAGEDPLAAQLALVAVGVESALREVYEATSSRAYGIALRVLGSSGLAEEAVMDTYMQVWRDAARFEPERGSVTTWISLLARTRAIDVRRRRARTRGEVELGQAVEVHDPAPAPPEALATRDHASRVRRAVAELPAAQREALTAAFLDGLTHTEVASKLGAPLGTVKTRIRQGLARLRQKLDALGVETWSEPAEGHRNDPQ